MNAADAGKVAVQYAEEVGYVNAKLVSAKRVKDLRWSVRLDVGIMYKRIGLILVNDDGSIHEFDFDFDK